MCFLSVKERLVNPVVLLKSLILQMSYLINI